MPAIPHLLDALSQRCGTWLFLDPAHNHCADSTLLDPIVRNYHDGHGPMPAGPGSFLLADRSGCSTGQVDLHSTGAFT
ncbi:hypothetical protein [Nonomuraea sp. NPDC049695]|uniref:hypothetical protein n=1 Tax=Nonomuraea sp. NPDC049695 TaxID=3154734 RepID=UPI003426516E